SNLKLSMPWLNPRLRELKGLRQRSSCGFPDSDFDNPLINFTGGLHFFTVTQYDPHRNRTECSMSFMHVIECAGFGGPEVLHWAERPMPVPASDEVLVKVAAAGVNRADLLHREGKYPPPPGASDLIGLEVAGIVAAAGKDVHRWR